MKALLVGLLAAVIASAAIANSNYFHPSDAIFKEHYVSALKGGGGVPSDMTDIDGTFMTVNDETWVDDTDGSDEHYTARLLVDVTPYLGKTVGDRYTGHGQLSDLRFSWKSIPPELEPERGQIEYLLHGIHPHMVWSFYVNRPGAVDWDTVDLVLQICPKQEGQFCAESRFQILVPYKPES